MTDDYYYHEFYYYYSAYICTYACFGVVVDVGADEAKFREEKEAEYNNSTSMMPVTVSPLEVLKKGFHSLLFLLFLSKLITIPISLYIIRLGLQRT